ncbi:hypothetical protein MMC07_001826 [Pseudocyphellaria aurata]|nr:hypothetical protein [Pseudocyphellaria aurata]
MLPFQRLTGNPSSGWSIYTSAFAGQTPCYSNPPLPLIPPTTSPNPANASISVISTKIFSLAYALAPPPSLGPSLSSGAKAGIAIGVLVGALAAVAISFFVLLRRRRAKASAKASANDEAGPVVASTEYRNSATLSNAIPPQEHISELPSPGIMDGRSSWFPQSPAQPPPISPIASALPAQPPEELPGSTYMHEHHPAFSPVSDRGEPFRPPITGADRSPEEVVSPIEKESRR